MYRVSSFLQHFAWALISGSLLASIWLNIDPASYYDIVEYRVLSLRGLSGRSDAIYTLRHFVAFALMPLFLFYLAKELWEALRLERGAMRRKRGGIPILGGLGGMIGAALVWVVLNSLWPMEEGIDATTGWTLTLGSDVVLTYMFGRLLFRPNSPALHVLLLLTIVMDIGGLLVFGLATVDLAPRLLWLVLPLLAAWAVWVFAARHRNHPQSELERQRALRLWPYLLAMFASWLGVAASGLPPALGLLPILPLIPHANHAFGMFAEAEELLHDPLNRIAHALVWPLVVTMALFGFTHGGIDLAAFAPVSLAVLGALWFGKPLGILAGALIVAPRLGYRLPPNLRRRHLGFIALLCGMGFTLPTLTMDGSLPGGYLQEAARFGLALSLLMGIFAIFLGRILRSTRRKR
ncbi:Na+/H+ antiporter NhaA [Neogemmobacter tilapiae]|uniref:Putative Na(+)/H(+) antiporter NhaA homolog n=1 Tax=Neogemmobacter tilapiae TaxID=875041 RepID=A0A918TFE3_9RHOB|nr:Na+/H+ antiporter NhaA [Gemmobacter tilapiae]GHC43711.1 Na(+)/H(+) antiporter NhaA [Gemmobacter tilapiae]